jgi:RimJ/RimL family protein N-acetyltransferase
LAQQALGTDLPFTVFHQESGRIAGGTRYLDIQRRNRGLEIGGTWYGVEYQRTGVNTECKYLLLRHAFETLGCHRVQLKTDLRNVRSQTAIERIGGIKEGVLRENVVMPDGYLRSTVMYSILEQEWPAVKAHLEQLMDR